jgi:hypothetical protein
MRVAAAELDDAARCADAIDVTAAFPLGVVVSADRRECTGPAWAPIVGFSATYAHHQKSLNASTSPQRYWLITTRNLNALLSTI